VNAGTMLISGLPSLVDTSAGEATLTFDITSNRQLANDHLYVWTYAPGTLDIAGATNSVVAGAIYDNSPKQWLDDDYGIDISNVTLLSSGLISRSPALAKSGGGQYHPRYWP